MDYIASREIDIDGPNKQRTDDGQPDSISENVLPPLWTLWRRQNKPNQQNVECSFAIF